MAGVDAPARNQPKLKQPCCGLNSHSKPFQSIPFRKINPFSSCNTQAFRYIDGVMKNQAAVALGRLGGKMTSPAKKRAARENAKLGGWPKGKPRKAKK
jgi:hypothetical protein